MLNTYLAAISVCLCLSVNVWADQASFERGQQLFEKSGCADCHTATVQDDFARKELAYEQPMRSRILTKLRTQAAIMQDRENRFGLYQTQGCQSIDTSFASEYARIHNVILQGNPVFPMPAWQQRSGVDNSSKGNTQAQNDIDDIIDYLLVSEGLVLTTDTINRWKKNLSDCVNAKATDVLINAGSPMRREKIQRRLEYLDKKIHAFDVLPTVTFLSYQTYLLNQVGYLEDGALDIWILRQASISEIYSSVETIVKEKKFPNPFLFIIVIDKSQPVYRAYFFKQPSMVNRPIFKKPKIFFLPEVIHNPNNFIDADMSDCFSCHASGVLRLRPRQRKGVPDLTADSWLLINQFNRKILTYGAVATDWPASQPTLSGRDSEPMTIKACQNCHQSASIRAPLLRFHSKGIVALMNAHEEKNGYYEYSLPNPDIMNMFLGKFQTEEPSISKRLLPAMPPLAPMTERENAELLNWIGDLK